jgi:hypothetical protein
MKRLFALLTAMTLAAPAMASYYIAGDFNTWNAAGNLMTDLGGNVWQVTLSGVSGRHEYKVTDGTWSQNWPGSGNSWFLGDGLGNVTLTFNANTISDGWYGNWGRLGVSTDPGAWTAVGDWQGWNNSTPSTAMTAQGGGIYKLSYVIPTAGSYQYKAVDTGTWDAIGSDFRGINATTLGFTTTGPNETVDFYVNAYAGTIKLDVAPLPEPSTAAFLLLGMGGFLLMRRRK